MSIALVTGASRGIGRACALALAKRGYDVAVNYVSNEAAAQAVVAEIEALGVRSLAVRATRQSCRRSRICSAPSCAKWAASMSS